MRAQGYNRLVFFLSSLLSLALPFLSSAADDKSRIGVIAPLTGYLSGIGSAVRNGVELAREERPDLFEAIRITFEDDQHDTKQSLLAYQRLAASEKPSAVFGFGTPLAYALGPLIERSAVPLLNFNFEPGPAIGKRSVIRTTNYAGQYMQALGEFLLKRGHSSFTIVQTESPFFNGMVKTFKEAADSRAQIRIVQAFQPTATDFRATIGKIKAAGDSPLGLFLNPDQLVSFVKQAKELGLERPLFGTDLFETAAEIAGPVKLFEGAIYPDNEVSADFRERYRARYGNQAQLTFAGSGYDMAVLMGEILARKPHSVIDELEAVQNQSGVLGRFSFRKEARVGSFFEYPIVVKAIRGSIGETVGETTP